MLFNVLLVDDDRRIRKGFEKYIEWNEIGFNSPFLAENLEQAQEVLSKNEVHLVITDICLNNETGLDLCKYIRDSFMDIPIFILSGYNDFEYARQAIKYGVKQYFTKPTDIAQFTLELKKIHEEIALRETAQQRNFAAEKRNNNSYKFLISLLYSDMAHGFVKEDRALHEFFEANSIRMPYPNFLIMKLMSTDKNLALYTGSLKAALEGIDCMVFPFQNAESHIFFLVNFLVFEDVNAVCTLFLEHTEQNTKINISQTVKQLNKLPDCMQKLQTVLANERINICKTESVNYGQKQLFDTNIESALFNALITCDRVKAKENIGIIISRCSNASQERMQDVIMQVLLRMQDYIKRFGLTYDDVFSNGFSISQYAKSAINVLDTEKCLNTAFDKIISVMEQNENAYHAGIINTIKIYVDNNYKSEVTLTDVSKLVHFSNFYVSKIFKKVTGENFTHYLVRVRMEKAMELLAQDNSKIYEISERIGYKSVKHFSQVFKTYIGKTPMEYRKMCLSLKGKLDEI